MDKPWSQVSGVFFLPPLDYAAMLAFVFNLRKSAAFPSSVFMKKSQGISPVSSIFFLAFEAHILQAACNTCNIWITRATGCTCAP